MIWLFGNAWWLLPALGAALVAVAALSGPGWPVVLAALRRVPWRVWAALGLVLALGLSFQFGRWVERSQQEARQDAAEVRADTKAAKVAGRAQAKADEAAATITKETSHVQERIRTVVRTLPATCPDLPAELHDGLQRQVEAARGRVPPAARQPDRGRAD